MHPAPDLDRPPGLAVGVGQLVAATSRDPADAHRERPAAAALVAGHRGDHAAYDVVAGRTGLVVVVGDREQGDHLGGEVDAGDARRRGRRLTCRQAAENRSCHCRRCGAGDRLARASAGRARRPPRRPAGRRSQPKPSACSSTYCSSPARRRNRSRRKSPWYLFSTAVTASSRVISSAATAAARSRAWTSSAEIGPSARTQTRRARSVPPGGHPQRRAPARRRRGTPSPSTRSTRTRPVGSTRSAAASRSPQVVGQGRGPLAAVGGGEQHPDVQDRATSSAIRPRSPPSSTIWVSAVCSASTRARARGGRHPGYQLLRPRSAGSLAQPHIGKP